MGRMEYAWKAFRICRFRLECANCLWNGPIGQEMPTEAQGFGVSLEALKRCTFSLECAEVSGNLKIAYEISRLPQSDSESE